MYTMQYVLHSLCGGGYFIIWAPNTTDSKVHDRLWVARSRLILDALCDEVRHLALNLLVPLVFSQLGLSLVTSPG